ncbi:sensor histidine kinase KdpD [Williamsia sp. CHRR-6]|uniref:sensor histidine kinase n=1 Tax=Williamsia sp. CHRR-6 TaxID=2835871 RepID=UPI002025A106|nr:HAMP domain-containing sensor histidine kinase [Williamsia sp. CHRR-6]
MLAMVLGIGVLLGVPLGFTAWWWVDEMGRQDLRQRLDRVAEELLRQEDAGRVASTVDVAPFRLLLPADAHLELQYPTASGATARTSVGDPVQGPQVSESIALGDSGSITMRIPRNAVRAEQWTAIGTVTLAVIASVLAGTVTAAITAKRLADPLEDLAQRAGTMAQGDFHSAWRTHGIAELDRVSTALEVANREIATRLQREGEIVGEVSHQLRSRLTAIALRLDELSLHHDPGVVAEAEAAHEQVQRLSGELDDLIAASRASSSRPRHPIRVRDTLDPVIRDYTNLFAEADREIEVRYRGADVAYATASRLREAVSVLLDNALRHGAGCCRVEVDVADGSELVRVSVGDDGEGIDDAVVPLIFRRGFSARGSTGLGLSLARALVEADGGRLDLTTRRPPTFTILVPNRPATPRVTAPRRVEPR